MQLALPLAPGGPWRPAEVDVLRRREGLLRTRVAVRGRAVLLSHAAGRDGAEVRLRAECDTPGAAALALRLHLRPLFVVEAQSDAPARLHWGLQRGVARQDARDFFAYAHRWLVGTLLWGDPSRPRRRALAAQVAGLLAEVAAPLLARCQPPLRSAAMRFAPAQRARLYGLFSRDERGWLRQSAAAAPGALLFALALVDSGDGAEAGVKLLHDLGQGRRLDAALGDALAAWQGAFPRWAAGAGPFHEDQRRAFLAAQAWTPAERERALAATRLLLRRAGPWVEPRLLLLPPPLRFAPEDIPAAPAANACWYRVMKLPRLTVAAPGARAPEALLAAFATFASRHAAALARAPAGLDLEDWLTEQLDVLRLAGRTPSRATDPARLAAEVDLAALRARPVGWRRAPLGEEDAPRPGPAGAEGRWDDLLALARAARAEGRRLDWAALAAEAGAPPALTAQAVAEGLAPPPPGPWALVAPEGFELAPPGPDAPAAPPVARPRPPAVEPPATPGGFTRWTARGVEVTPLLTADQLRAEGARMRHCVATYRDEVEAGRLAVFSAQVHGRRLTVSLARRQGGWRYSECSGFANRQPGRDELFALLPWARAFGVSWVGARHGG